MNEETATVRYKVYVEKQVYVNHDDDDNTAADKIHDQMWTCLLYTSPSPRDKRQSRMPSSA